MPPGTFVNIVMAPLVPGDFLNVRAALVFGIARALHQREQTIVAGAAR